MFRRITALLLIFTFFIPAFASAGRVPGGRPGGGHMPPVVPEKIVEPEIPDHTSRERQLSEQRKADAVDGVTASPYWLRQLYLAYHNFNGRFTTKTGETILFYETLSKLYSRNGNSIALSLRADTDDMKSVRFELDEEAITAFERYNITRIAFFDFEENVYGQMKVSALREKYTELGLSGSQSMIYRFETETWSMKRE